MRSKEEEYDDDGDDNDMPIIMDDNKKSIEKENKWMWLRTKRRIQIGEKWIFIQKKKRKLREGFGHTKTLNFQPFLLNLVFRLTCQFRKSPGRSMISPSKSMNGWYSKLLKIASVGI